MSLVIPFRNDKSIGFTASFLLHGALIFAGGFVFSNPAEYAVEAGSGGMEVSLIAAPSEPVAIGTVAQKLPETVQEEAITEEQVLPKETTEKERPAADSPYKGDGSSSIPGKDKTTFYSAGGAIAEAKPGYLKNPAPPYPWEARQKGWQGVVVLKVFIDKAGHPTRIEKEKSSGFDVLDEAALKTVGSWRFHPAQIGTLPVESSVRVPIRFELENLKRR